MKIVSSPRNRRRSSRRIAQAAAWVCLVVAVSGANAQSNFIPTTTASWNAAENWSPNGVPNRTGVATTFSSPTATQAVTLDAAITVGSISLTNNSARVFTLADGSGGSLAFSVNSGNASFTLDGTSTAINVLSASSTLTSTLSATINNTSVTSAAGALQITGTLAGAGGFIKDGAGTLSFATTAKSYTGATTVSAGVLKTSVEGIPTATSGVTVSSGGTLLLSPGSSSQPFKFGGSASTVITLNGTGAAILQGDTMPGGAGALRADTSTTLSNNINLASDSTIVPVANLVLSGTINGSGALTKTGSGTLTLSLANSYTGGTVVTAGTLTATTATSLGASTGALTVNNAGTTASAVVVNLSMAAATTTGSLSGAITAPTSGSNTVTINNRGSIYTVNQTVAGTFGGIIAGTGGLTLGSLSTNKLTLTGANTYSGATLISAGTLKLDSAGSTTARLTSTATAITVGNGGTLLLANSSAISSTDRINDAGTITLNGGGTINTGGLSEGTRPTAPTGGTAGSAGLGALTLASTTSIAHAKIDFGSGANGSSLVFTSLSGATGAYVDILNFNGAMLTDNGSNTNDRLLFATDPNLSDDALAHFVFYDDNSLLIANGAKIIPYGNEYEIVPAPEPTTILGSVLLAVGAIWSQRRRLRGV